MAQVKSEEVKLKAEIPEKISGSVSQGETFVPPVSSLPHPKSRPLVLHVLVGSQETWLNAA